MCKLNMQSEMLTKIELIQGQIYELLVINTSEQASKLVRRAYICTDRSSHVVAIHTITATAADKQLLVSAFIQC